jgi:hypothetical protein
MSISRIDLFRNNASVRTMQSTEASGLSVEQQISKWQSLKRTENSMRELRDAYVFLMAVQFVGASMPVSISRDTTEYVEALMTADLVRLRKP